MYYCLQRDDIPVFINCPPDRIYPTDAGSDSAAAFWVPPPFSDETGPLVPVESHSSGSRFTIGTTQVTYVATDVTNNTATCAFTITVEDRENPTFSGCPSPASGKTLAGTTTSISWTPPTANDNSGLSLTITATHDPGDTFAIGNTAVSYTALDVGGNTAVCTFTVTVEETTGPVFSNCPQSQSVNNDAGQNFAIVSWTEPTASDDDDVPTVMSTYNAGDAFDIGVTLVTYSAIDSDGFTAMCAFAITVADAENPIIANCPSDVTTNVLPTSIPVTLSWRQPTTSDNADQSVSLVSNHNSGDTFPGGQTQVIYTARDNAGNQATCTFTINVIVVDPADTTSYNGTLGLDRIASVNGPFTRSTGLLDDKLIQQIDAVLRTSSIGANYVGIDSITASLNSNGIAVLEYMLHVIQDSGYSVQVIEQSFDDNLMGMNDNEFLDGNRVVNQSFVVGICPVDFCMNDGQCYLDKDNFVSACQCSSGYTGVQCESEASLSLTVIIVISITSGIFVIVIILLIICCLLSFMSHENGDKSSDQEKFKLSEAEKARGTHNPVPVVMVSGGKSGMQNGGVDVIHEDVFYPNGVPMPKSTQNGTIGAKPVLKYPNGTIPNGKIYIPNGSTLVPNGSTHLPNGTISNGKLYVPNGSTHVPNGSTGLPNGTISNGKLYVPNGSTRLPNGAIVIPYGSASKPQNLVPVSTSTYIPPNSNPNISNNTSYIQARIVPTHSNGTAYIPSNSTPNKSYYVPPNPEPDSGPKFKHKSPQFLVKGSRQSANPRYLLDDKYRFLLDDRPRVVVPLRKTKSYGDDYRITYDNEDDRRRRRRRRHRKHRSKSLGHRFVYISPSPDVPRQRRRRRRSHPRRTASLRLPRHPDRDYTVPRELRQEFMEAQLNEGAFDSSDNSGHRARKLEHLNLETSRTQQQDSFGQPQAPVSTASQPVNDVPPPPAFPPPPPPINQPAPTSN
ncbi:uncharacterized protein [Amphiura filiformis]|uniref:uncharacterized protein n=1 Tax=Amphiura filiformis TaxID=82378 RepID=UPI003B21D12C